MFDQYRKTILAGAVALTCGLTAASTFAAGFQPAQPAGKLGAVVVDPYGNAPLTALVELDSHIISDVKVTCTWQRGKRRSCYLYRWERVFRNL